MSLGGCHGEILSAFSSGGLEKNNNKLTGNDFSLLGLSLASNSVSAIKNMEVTVGPLTLCGDPSAELPLVRVCARLGTLCSSGQAL